MAESFSFKWLQGTRTSLGFTSANKGPHIKNHQQLTIARHSLPMLLLAKGNWPVTDVGHVNAWKAQKLKRCMDTSQVPAQRTGYRTIPW